jgi:hypothetical protein
MQAGAGEVASRVLLRYGPIYAFGGANRREPVGGSAYGMDLKYTALEEPLHCPPWRAPASMVTVGVVVEPLLQVKEALEEVRKTL